VNVPDRELAAFVVESGLARDADETKWTPLTGGVSSDIWRVETKETAFCVKRALPQLKVESDWHVPVGRNAYEWDYLQVVNAIAPGHAPQPLAHDPERGIFAMAWLAPENYPLWKGELLAGRVDATAAAAVGDLLGRIHATSVRDRTLADRFATDDLFHQLRIAPYLLATAQKHVDFADVLTALARRTAATRRALVHGDVSPKNILLGPNGPVLLDAECAWFGDPAFDLAFCLNHLLIKRRVVPGTKEALGASVDRLAECYLRQVDWEPRDDLEARAATLLPALALARVDGKSPLEYLDESQRDQLRQDCRAALAAQPASLAQVKALLGG
jgi:aminoglycoside phosphotransferase (APT) family kinase protein